MSDTFDDGQGQQPTGDGQVPAGSSPAAPPNQVPASGTPGQQPQADRSGWIPPHRFQEVTRANAEMRARIEAFEKQFGTMRTGLEQALGRQPNDGPQYDEATTRIREQLLTVFPELKQFVERSKDFGSILERLPSLDSFMENQLHGQGRRYFGLLDAELKKHFAEEDGKINPTAQRFFQTAFIDYLQTVPEAAARYERGDESVVSEWFGKHVQGPLIDRIRRSAHAQTVTRGDIVTRLPRQTPATSVVQGQQPAKPKSRDEMLEAAWDAMNNQG